LNKEGFISLLGPLYEHSPWAAAVAFGRRPFASLEALGAAIREAVDGASAADQLALIRAHPELAGEKLRRRELTSASMGEQARLGLDQLGEADLREWAQLNARYRERFGFPFVICVRLHSREQILAAIRSRLDGHPEAETREAIRQIHDIARLRLDDLIARLEA
jgi:2-oxo-4-hydroxy-4-carboxy-5-ureidoimidazoline decarboxylase